MSARDRFESWTAMPVQIGELVALMDDGVTPLVLDPSQPEAPARQARSVVDLHAAHIGRQVGRGLGNQLQHAVAKSVHINSSSFDSWLIFAGKLRR